MFTDRSKTVGELSLYNMIKWLSEGSNLFRKLHIFVRAHTIYYAFTLLVETIFRIAHDI